ncbi:MAG: hypothetical protein AB1758_15950 [Candidatus Eremiobacterota bacterium]
MKPDEPRDYPAYRERLLEEQRGALRGLEFPWSVPAGIRAKVAEDGRLLPFFGDTVVFRLGDRDREWLAALRDRLVDGLEGLFAEPLDPREFHLTLHDLSSGSVRGELPLEANQERCRSILAGLQPGTRVEMEATTVFPCLNISVLVGFCPASEADYRLLTAWHRAFDPVVELGYWLRPHVTLAYFRPRALSAGEVERLSERLAGFEVGGRRLNLQRSLLEYQHFLDMNRYQSPFSRKA